MCRGGFRVALSVGRPSLEFEGEFNWRFEPSYFKRA